MQHKIHAIRHALREKSLDALLVTDLINIGYLSGFTGSSAYVLVTANDAILITDARYTLRAKSECPDFGVVISSVGAGYPETLFQRIGELPGVKRVGIESNHLTVAQWEKFKRDAPNVEWVPTDNIVEELRLIKTSEEVAKIVLAVAIAETAFNLVKPLLVPGLPERSFAIELELAMRRAGADAAAFDTIVASGPQGARPHHQPNTRLLETGDFVTIDWGAQAEGYCSDITRTVFIGSDADITDKQREIYNIVLKAQQLAIAAIAPGKTGKEIDAVARDYIAAAGYGDAFSHSLGHSLGRDVHDGPGLSTRSDKLILKPGMVLTVEPGIYLEDWGGIRIEEDVLVTETGCEVLTNLPNGLDFRL